MKDFIDEWRSPRPYIEAHTSGSTGQPKDILLLKSDMRVSALNTIRFFGLNENSVVAIPLSASYIAGKMMAVRAELCGGRLLELPVSNRIELVEPVDLISVVPSQLESLLQLDRELVRGILIGGAPMSTRQEEAVMASGIPAWIGYGMTETCSHVALRRVGASPVYHAVGDVTFTADKYGCLVIHSQEFSWKTLITRDVVSIESPTSFMWLGRADNVINSGGLKIHPEKLEEEIRLLLPGLQEFYIASEPHAKWGQAVVMVIDETEYTSFQDLPERLERGLSDSRHFPHRFLVTDKLPKTSNNKIIRKLPETYYEI